MEQLDDHAPLYPLIEEQSFVREETPTQNSKAKQKTRSTSAPELGMMSSSSRYANAERSCGKPADHVHSVRKYLKKGLVSKSDKSDKDTRTGQTGHVYILRDPEEPNFIKIGSSEHPPDRMKELVAKCGFKPFMETFESEFLDIAVAQKAEGLAQKELKSFRRRFVCRCGEKHREFFKVDFEVAKTAVKRWIAIMELGVYLADHTMDDRWLLRINKHIQKYQPSLDHNTEEGRQKWWERLETELKASKAADTQDARGENLVLTTAMSSQQSTGQGWLAYCIFQAVLFLWLSPPGLARLIWWLNFMAIITTCALSSSPVFQAAQHSLVVLISIGVKMRTIHRVIVRRRNGQLLAS
jgi:hypothetical protein